MASDDINKEYILKYCILGDMSLKQAREALRISPHKIHRLIDEIAANHCLPPAPIGTQKFNYIRKDIRSLCGFIDEETSQMNRTVIHENTVPLDDNIDRIVFNDGRVNPCPTLDELDETVK
jgi:hypothetical protein